MKLPTSKTSEFQLWKKDCIESTPFLRIWWAKQQYRSFLEGRISKVRNCYLLLIQKKKNSSIQKFLIQA